MAINLEKAVFKKISIIFLLLFSPMCFGAELHDPTRPGSYADDLPISTGNSLTLDEILLSPSRCVAVINGMALQVGDSDSGIKLLSIDENAVRISKDKREVTLTLPLSDEAQSAINIK